MQTTLKRLKNIPVRVKAIIMKSPRWVKIIKKDSL